MTTSSFNQNPTLNPMEAPPNSGGRVRSMPSAYRIFLMGFLTVALATQSGCQIFKRFGSSPQNIPVVYEDLPSQQQLLETISDRNRSASQLNTNVTVTMPGLPRIKGTIQVEYPSRLRMKAGLAGMSEMGVDVGCNDDQFWLWSKASLPGQEPPTLYYARHDAYQTSEVRQAIPVEPKWLIEAMGLVDFGPTDVHYGPTIDPNGRLKLFTVQQTPSGPQTRVTLFAATTGLIEQQAIYDSSDRLIAYSNSSHYKSYPQDHVSLPQRIELHMIQPDGSDTKLIVDLGTFSINSLFGEPSKMWTMPNPEGIPKIDLARLPSPVGSVAPPRFGPE